MGRSRRSWSSCSPTRIRYTLDVAALSHRQRLVRAGFLPAIVFAMQAGGGNIYFGLWYPVVVAGITCVIGSIFIRETKDHKIDVW